MRTFHLCLALEQIYFEKSIEKNIVFFHNIVFHEIQTFPCIFEYEYFGITKMQRFILICWNGLKHSDVNHLRNETLFSCGALDV